MDIRMTNPEPFRSSTPAASFGIIRRKKMSWPMVISANGRQSQPGSDDNTLYYFVP
jgi:hypothetical protein